MTQQELAREILALPANQRKAVEALIVSFQQKNQSAAPAEIGASIDLASDPFVGMWSARNDLADSSDWVRNVRRNEW